MYYVCPFSYTAFWLVGQLGSHNRFNNTTFISVGPPAYRPKLGYTRHLIEVFALSFCLFDIFIGKGASVIRLSQISSVFIY